MVYYMHTVLKGSTMHNHIYINFEKCIGGVIVSLLASSVVDHGFEPWSVQTKDYRIGICCLSAIHTILMSTNRIMIMCLSKATCLSTDCCFSELALLKSNKACWSSTKRASSSSHRNTS